MAQYRVKEAKKGVKWMFQKEFEDEEDGRKKEDKNFKINMKLPELESSRLLLRMLNELDADFIFSLRSDPRVNKYIDRDPATSIEQATEFISKVNDNIAAGTSYYWSILLRNTLSMIGTICLWNISEDRKSVELGYELHPDYQGKGYMDEAIKEVINFAFQNGFTKLEAFTHRDNQASTKLLMKNQFVLSEEKKDEVVDNEYWVLVK